MNVLLSEDNTIKCRLSHSLERSNFSWQLFLIKLLPELIQKWRLRRILAKQYTSN